MTALLTDNLPLLSGAPNGIKKLRELILELAVRGKLVPQDPNDEPASELLKRIEVEMAQLIEQKVVRKGKPLPEIEQNEIKFKLPKGWEWIRLGQIGDWGAGATPARGNSRYYGGEMPWFKSGELVADFISDSKESVTELALKECSLRRNKPGDVLIAMYGATIGKTAILGVEGTTNQAVCACTPLNGVFNRYLLLNLKALKSNFIGQGAGGAQPNISREKVIATITGLPPVAEQHRIVAKVDELMALCDRLEAQQADAESAHAELVQALLDSLTKANDASEFAANWLRLAEHFHTLFTTEPSIDALKQTLLQLAVMGKLVPQDPNDEPASELLKRITEEKKRLVADGKIKRQKSLPEVGEMNSPYLLPLNWKWVHLGEISEFINGDRGKNYPNRAEYVSAGIPWINTGHIEPEGTLSQDKMHFITREKFESLNGGKLQIGDLVYCLRGATFGKTAIVDPYVEGAIASSLMIIRPFWPCSNRYMYRYLISQTGREQIFRFDNGSAQPNLSANNVRLYVYPLPPLAEQHRIVAKVDQLMALCGQLKARLTQARQLNEQLASTLVEQAVA